MFSSSVNFDGVYILSNSNTTVCILPGVDCIKILIYYELYLYASSFQLGVILPPEGIWGISLVVSLVVLLAFSGYRPGNTT